MHIFLLLELRCYRNSILAHNLQTEFKEISYKIYYTDAMLCQLKYTKSQKNFNITFYYSTRGHYLINIFIYIYIYIYFKIIYILYSYIVYFVLSL